MGLRIIPAAEAAAGSKERVIIYGRAGIGKSRLGGSVPEDWGKILYYAADTNSEFLSSISAKKRERFIVVKPEGDDPTVNFMEFCIRDWTKVDPEIGVIIVDTYTKVAMDTISYAANSGTMDREKHYIIGDPKRGGQAIPNRGDYQAIESLSKGFLEQLFQHQKDKHIIFICHEDVKIVEGVSSVGGPAHPGRAMTEYLPAQFNTVIRLIREPVLVPGESSPRDTVVAITENDGKYIAKVRTDDELSPNPLAKVYLDRDPSSFWVQYMSTFVPKETPNV